MTDHYQIGPVSRTCVNVPGQEHGNNNSNQRRRRSNYDDYSESCYDDDDPDENESEQDGTCQCMRCPAHLFTSVLLGLLACVLVTGGVFLAFHKWDHTWLLVSGIGVILMAIGTAMHCCSTPDVNKKAGSHRCKGGCASGNSGSRSQPNQKGSDAIGNGSVLTEQLLPLSNARSVSQLSLNMVPGYFPPLVYSTNGAPYSLEQHSAVVQNISRLVQHQTQLHLQQPDAAQSGLNAAKSFILVPLPSQSTDAASIQNIVAAVCQLDATNISLDTEAHEVQTTEIISQPTRPSLAIDENVVNNAATAGQLQQTVQTNFLSSQPSHKHVEVQTCCEWTISAQNINERKPTNPVSTSTVDNGETSCSSNITAEFSCQTSEMETLPLACLIDTNNSSTTEQSHPSDNLQQPTNENLVLQQNHICLTEASCNATNCDNSSTDSIPNLLTFDEPIPVETISIHSSLINESESVTLPSTTDGTTDIQIEILPQQLVRSAIPVLVPEREPSLNDVISSTETAQIQNIGSQQIDSENTENASIIAPHVPGNLEFTSQENSSNSTLETNSVSSENVNTQMPSLMYEDTPSELSDFDDTEFLERSSPPPSYEDVAQETTSVGGVFGASYGTM